MRLVGLLLSRIVERGLSYLNSYIFMFLKVVNFHIIIGYKLNEFGQKIQTIFFVASEVLSTGAFLTKQNTALRRVGGRLFPVKQTEQLGISVH